MNFTDFQTWLNFHGAGLVIDGQPGPATRQAIKDVFVNLDALAITEDEIDQFASNLGCTHNQLASVAAVESSGSGFDSHGRPKILFERHKFHKFTDGKYSVTSYSSPSVGGYNEDSWEKLAQAACKDVDAAFKSVSWGKFQVMGFWFPNMGFASPLEMAYSTVWGESSHYRLFAGYVGFIANLTDELQKVSSDPDDCRPFASGYNGSGYEANGYHIKIAAEMERRGG